MKFIIKKKYLMITGGLVLLLFIGCNLKPGKSSVESAVQSALQNNIPISWVGNLMGGKNAKITTVEIVQWGSYNKEQKYWPIRIRVIGSAELKDPFNPGKVEKFDKIAEFLLKKDDFGKWQAQLKGGRYQ